MKSLIQTKSEYTGHRVYVDELGKRYPSISNVSNFFFSRYGIIAWQKKLGEEQARVATQQSARRGTLVHSAIEHNNPVCEDAEIQPYVDVYFQEVASKITTISVEERLYYDDGEVYFAGTSDAILLYEGIEGLLVGDWKTSEKPKNPQYFGAYSLQLAAYALAYSQRHQCESINNGIVFSITPSKAHKFLLDLSYAKTFLLSTIMPAYFAFYSTPEETRGYPSDFIKKEINQFNKELPQYIKELD